MRDWHRPLMLLAAAMAVLAGVCVVGLIVDPRVLTGAPIWAKPLKFAVSIALYAPTLGWMISLVDGQRARRLSHLLGTVVAVAMAVEMVVIVGQVVRGRASHFDVATPLDAALWGVMAVTIVTLFLAVVGLGVVLIRQRSLPVDVAWAVRLGVGISLLGMALAFLMTSPTPAQLAAARATGTLTTSGAHTVGAPDGGPGLPLLGWSTVGGDLRIGHFVGLHAMQALPLLLLALAGLAGSVPALADRRVRARLVGVAGAAWAGLTLLLTWQALRAQPLIHPDGPTLVVLGALVVATAVATLVVLRLGPHAATDTAAGPTSTSVATAGSPPAR